MMAPSAKNYPHGLKVAVTLILISSLAFPPSKSVGLQLGSRPPGCVNKCMNCRPCVATLVIPPHDPKKNGLRKSSSHQDAHQDDDTYYLLSWKCRCGNKLYQP